MYSFIQTQWPFKKIQMTPQNTPNAFKTTSYITNKSIMDNLTTRSDIMMAWNEASLISLHRKPRWNTKPLHVSWSCMLTLNCVIQSLHTCTIPLDEKNTLNFIHKTYTSARYRQTAADIPSSSRYRPDVDKPLPIFRLPADIGLMWAFVLRYHNGVYTFLCVSFKNACDFNRTYSVGRMLVCEF